MMPRKKRIALAIAIPVIIVMIIITTGILLYLNTDMFKSNKTLFLKYLGENSENLKAIQDVFESSEYEKKLQDNKYTETTEIKANYTNNLQTTSEDTSNSINKAKIIIKGQKDQPNKYCYKDFKLIKEEDSTISEGNQNNDENSNSTNNEQGIAEIEYIQNNDNYGVRFSDLFKQYLLVENNNLKELFEKIGYSEQQLDNIPNSFEIDKMTLEDIKFTEEELNNIKERYVNIVSKNVTDKNFEKKSKQIISINDKNISTNAYILNLTNEQLNNLYINLLEDLKQDDIILNKIEKIQEKISLIKINSSESLNLKEKFIENIDSTIEKINKTNIGSQETKIIVYENEGKTIRMTVQGKDYEINFDFLQEQEENEFVITIKKEDIETQKLEINKNNEGLKIYIQNNNTDNPIKISFEQNKNETNTNSSNDSSIKYEIKNSKIEVNIKQKTDIVDNFENQNVLNDQNSIELNKLEKEQLNAVLNQVTNALQQKTDSISQEIKGEDIQELLKTLGIIKNEQKIEGGEITETEKNRFNSKFEILAGENLDNENVLKVVEGLKENVLKAQVGSNQEIKVEVNKDSNNEEVGRTLEEYIKEKEDTKYNVTIEHDENTGLVKYVIMTPVEKN